MLRVTKRVERGAKVDQHEIGSGSDEQHGKAPPSLDGIGKLGERVRNRVALLRQEVGRQRANRPAIDLEHLME